MSPAFQILTAVQEIEFRDDVISRWLDTYPGWPDEWPCVTYRMITSLVGDALEHWGWPVTPPAPEVEELVDRLGWIAAQLTDIEWPYHARVVSQAAALLKGWQLSSEQQELPADPVDPSL